MKYKNVPGYVPGLTALQQAEKALKPVSDFSKILIRANPILDHPVFKIMEREQRIIDMFKGPLS